MFCCSPSHAHAIVAPMIRPLPILLLFLATVTSGCATYTREECSSGNWEKIGQQDGSDGRSPDRFDLHVKACGLDRSDASRATYMAGRDKGLAAYCTDARGYREGALGQKYLGVCPAALEPQFVTGFNLGQRIYQAESRQSDVADALRAASTAQEKQKLAAENERLKLEIEKLRAQGDALVNASRKKTKKKN